MQSKKSKSRKSYCGQHGKKKKKKKIYKLRRKSELDHEKIYSCNSDDSDTGSDTNNEVYFNRGNKHT